MLSYSFPSFCISTSAMCISLSNANKSAIYKGTFSYFLVVSIGFVLREMRDPEIDEVAVVQLNITNPLSNDFTVTVNSVDGTATGDE